MDLRVTGVDLSPRRAIARKPCATLRRLTTTGQSVTREPDIRLATYGTLGPGRPNHGQLSDLPGRWLVGRVRGSLVDAGWGAGFGYPALILDADGSLIDVDVFESAALPRHWDRLDAFEGPGYRRVAVEVATAEGLLPASIYVLADPIDPS
jgi:gamma-glutamylcyclotransferase (GGCT)/AIG2-like uncharacterized protein YtfP